MMYISGARSCKANKTAIATGLTTGAIIALTMVGCANPKVTFSEQGQKAFLVTCRGPFTSWSSCLVKAGRLCKDRGYEIVHGDEFDRKMIVSCKAK